MAREISELHYVSSIIFLFDHGKWTEELVGYRPWGCTESDTTERLSFSLFMLSWLTPLRRPYSMATKSVFTCWWKMGSSGVQKTATLRQMSVGLLHPMPFLVLHGGVCLPGTVSLRLWFSEVPRASGGGKQMHDIENAESRGQSEFQSHIFYLSDHCACSTSSVRGWPVTGQSWQRRWWRWMSVQHSTWSLANISETVDETHDQPPSAAKKMRDPGQKLPAPNPMNLMQHRQKLIIQAKHACLILTVHVC